MIVRRWLWLCALYVGAVLLPAVHCTPYPNGVADNPEVDCGATNISITFTTRENFDGRVFVKGFAHEPRCRSAVHGRRTTVISIPRHECGVAILQVPGGLVVHARVQISFHPRFITKVDQSYDVQCLYQQQEKSVSYPVSVSMITLIPLPLNAEMPRCRYEVHENDADGKLVSTARIGDALYHKWTCASSIPELWCMTVYNCFVDDGSGARIDIVDTDGCAVDKYVLGNIEYQSNLMAGKEAHAFKFADRVVVNFQCSIRLSPKNDTSFRNDTLDTCPHPQCKALRRRAAISGEVNEDNVDKDMLDVEQILLGDSLGTTNDEMSVVVDVRSQPVEVLDLPSAADSPSLSDPTDTPSLSSFVLENGLYCVQFVYLALIASTTFCLSLVGCILVLAYLRLCARVKKTA